MQGKIIKGIAGFYYVYADGVGIVTCKARGIFRNQNQKPLVGDDVEMELIPEEEGTGSITKLMPRKSELLRPAVANVDLALIIFALHQPEPSFNLIDRFLCRMEHQGMQTAICINKCDLLAYVPGGQKREEYEAGLTDSSGLRSVLGEKHISQPCALKKDSLDLESIRGIYEPAGYPVLFTSAATGEGIPELAAFLQGKTTTVAGPSGVGKSSLINHLLGEQAMETGNLSEKLGRGKHTTRHSEILPIDSHTFIVDTPGFGSLDLPEIEAQELAGCYPEFVWEEPGCRFRGCSHINEPDCAVKQAVEEGRISEVRYKNYKILYEELKNRRRY